MAAPCPTAVSGSAETTTLDTLAADTFKSPDDANAWMRRPHPVLDDETPQAVAATPAGAQRVRDILLAIRYGGAV